MTRENAIKQLKRMKSNKNYTGDECNAIMAAIKELEQEMRDATPEEQKSVHDYIKSISKPTGADFGKEQEPCEDAISRQEVKEQMIKYGFHAPDMTVTEFVEDLPSVTAERTGHWVLLDECANSGYYCSNCQKKLVKEGWSKTVKKIKYCPNCGAKMSKIPTNSEKERKMKLIIDISEDVYTRLFDNGIQDNEIATDDIGEMAKALRCGTPLDNIKAKIEQLPTKTRTNWNGCCPDIDYPEIEYVDVTKRELLRIIDEGTSE